MASYQASYILSVLAISFTVALLALQYHVMVFLLNRAQCHLRFINVQTKPCVPSSKAVLLAAIYFYVSPSSHAKDALFHRADAKGIGVAQYSERQLVIRLPYAQAYTCLFVCLVVVVYSSRPQILTQGTPTQ